MRLPVASLNYTFFSNFSPRRVHKKIPMPQTILDGPKNPNYFNEHTRFLLQEWYLQEPYPTLTKRQEIAEATGLTPIQVGYWFQDRRRGRVTYSKNK